MQFSVVCPNDGPVEVSLEDVSAILFDGSDTIEVALTCPECGDEIRVSFFIPNLLAAAMGFAEMLQVAPGSESISFELVELEEDEDEEDFTPSYRRRRSMVDEGRIDRYCEYFRRQLARVDNVDAMLSEIDSGY